MNISCCFNFLFHTVLFLLFYNKYNLLLVIFNNMNSKSKQFIRFLEDYDHCLNCVLSFFLSQSPCSRGSQQLRAEVVLERGNWLVCWEDLTQEAKEKAIWQACSHHMNKLRRGSFEIC